MKSTCRWFAFGLLAAVVAWTGGCSGPHEPPKNVLLVSIDTLRADYVGCYGDEHARTPSLDRLAREGARFDAAMAPTPITLPSHAAMLTGIQPWTLGIRHNGLYRLDERFVTLAERLAQSGFVTGAVIGGYPLNASSGMAQGFAHFDDDIPTETARYDMPRRPAEEVSDAAVAWLEQRSEPFFLFLHYYDPHTPYDPPAEYQSMPSSAGRAAQGLASYRGEIAYADAQIGRVFAALESAGKLDETLVIVTSDHGEGLMDHGELTHGVFLYEEITRVPLLMRHPPSLDPRTVSSVVGLVDLVPTVLEALGLGGDEALEGTSVWPLARDGREFPRNEAASESHFGRIEYGWAPLRSLRTAGHRFVDAPRPELYDRSVDPGEKTNVYEAEGKLAADLAGRLEGHFENLAEDAPSDIDEEELARLQSLGYFQGGGPESAEQGELPDPKDKIRGQQMLQLATFSVAQGQLGIAESQFRGIIDADPGNITARCRLADLYMTRDDLAQAHATLDEALRLAANDPQQSAQVIRRMATLARKQGKIDDAIEFYRQRRSIGPPSARHIAAEALLLIERGRHDEAQALLDEHLTTNDASVPVLRAQAKLHAALGETDQAQEVWRQVLDKRPGDEEAQAALQVATR